eukprot:scaffold76232_cov20-Prasinocladus_malaysianus.AAC.1
MQMKTGDFCRNVYIACFKGKEWSIPKPPSYAFYAATVRPHFHACRSRGMNVLSGRVTGREQ